RESRRAPGARLRDARSRELAARRQAHHARVLLRGADGKRPGPRLDHGLRAGHEDRRGDPGARRPALPLARAYCWARAIAAISCAAAALGRPGPEAASDQIIISSSVPSSEESMRRRSAGCCAPPSAVSSFGRAFWISMICSIACCAISNAIVTMICGPAARKAPAMSAPSAPAPAPPAATVLVPDSTPAMPALTSALAIARIAARRANGNTAFFTPGFAKIIVYIVVAPPVTARLRAMPAALMTWKSGGTVP